MRRTLVIASRDLKSAFDGPLAWVLTAVFLSISGFFFCFFLFRYSDLSDAMRAASTSNPRLLDNLSLDRAVVDPTLRTVSLLLIFLVPLLTMRSLADERRQGTIELLLTSPATPVEVVVGKFLGAFAIVAIPIALTVFYPLVLIAVATPEAGPLASGYLGLFLVAAALVALGLLGSSLTDSPVVAAFLGFALIIASFFCGMGASMNTPFGDALSWFSVFKHYDGLAAGIVDTGDLAFFAAIITGSLFLSLRVVDSHRWR